jgi:hypothetical protein
MGRAIPTPLPAAGEFRNLSPKKQAKRLKEALGVFVDALQIEGRDPRAPESNLFQNAIDALGEGNLEQAYEYAAALQSQAISHDSTVDVCGQSMSRNELACGLRNLVDRRAAHKHGGEHAAR